MSSLPCFKCPSFSVWHSCQCFTSWQHPPLGTSVSPQCVCVHQPLFCLSFFIFATFSMPTAGRGDRTHMLNETVSVPQSFLPSYLSLPSFPLKFILPTTSDNTPVSFSFVFLFSPWLLLNYLLPPSTPLCNWRIFVIIKFGRLKHNEKDCLGKNSLVQHIMLLL